jgi:hypothetical protein
MLSDGGSLSTIGLRIRRLTHQAIVSKEFLNWPAQFRAFSVQVDRNWDSIVSAAHRSHLLRPLPVRHGVLSLLPYFEDSGNAQKGVNKASIGFSVRYRPF